MPQSEKDVEMLPFKGLSEMVGLEHKTGKNFDEYSINGQICINICIST